MCSFKLQTHQNPFSVPDPAVGGGAYDASPDSVISYSYSKATPARTFPLDAISVPTAPRFLGPFQSKFLATPIWSYVCVSAALMSWK